MKPAPLRFLTWNLSYAYGLGSDGAPYAGQKYQQKSKLHFEFVLNAMADFIRNLKFDIVFLQEVDFDASRSGHINQLDWISRRSNLLYRQPLVSWDAAYVPFPGLNPKHFFGRVKSGGAILSRYPIAPIQSDLLPKPRENSTLYNHFYLSRYLQMCTVAVPDRAKPLHLMNLHLEAFSASNRELHLLKTSERLVDYEIDVAAGDFNGPILLGDTAKKDWTPLEYEGATFPSNHPTAAFDGVIVKNTGLEFSKPIVYDTGELSDHRALGFDLKA